MAKHLTAPTATTELPGGIPYIIGNEAAERFSFYGMRAILMVFMTRHLVMHDGAPNVMSEEQATEYYHLFVAAVYFTPIVGALIADIFFGKYITILALSIVYCLGHLVLAINETSVGLAVGIGDTQQGLAIGLGLIAFGAGGIKPCVSAHVGDQFGKANHHLLAKVFSWFYWSINLGAFTSMVLTPILLDRFGSAVAFGVPGVLMTIATFCFWLGRNRFIHIPPGGMKFVKETFSGEGIKVALKLCVIYAFVAIFWALFDQTGSRWVLQAEKMDLHLLGLDLLPSQIQSVNSLLVLLLIPVFTYGLYPALNRLFELTPLRKMAIGMFLTVISFAIPAWVEQWITAGETPTIAWQLLAYLFLTAAEVMISITCLEFSYTQAPKAMKSFIMALFLMSVSGGNLFTWAVNHFIQKPDGTSKLVGADYYWFFTYTMLIMAFLFLFVVKFFKEKVYIHDAVEDAIDHSEATEEGVGR